MMGHESDLLEHGQPLHNKIWFLSLLSEIASPAAPILTSKRNGSLSHLLPLNTPVLPFHAALMHHPSKN